MSNPIRFDPLLVRHLARELEARLRDRSSASSPLFTADRAVVLPLDRGEALRLDLHPTRGWIRIVPAAAPGEGEAETSARILSVHAPPDERRLSVRLRGGSRFQTVERRLVVELHTNQWNALLLDEEDTILTVLRARDAGGRTLVPGARYAPPAGQPRAGRDEGWEDLLERWIARLGPLPAEERPRALVREFADTGTLSAPFLLGPAAVPAPPRPHDTGAHPDAGARAGAEAERGGEAAPGGTAERRGRVEPDDPGAGDGPPTADRRADREDARALEEAFERWWELISAERASPVLLHLDSGPHPYPFALPGIASEPVRSLLAGMERVAAEQPAESAEETDLLASAHARLLEARRKVRRVAEALEGAADPAEPRGWGDLLLARLRLVPRGASYVRVRGWDGKEIDIELDPALSPAENAERWYEEAKRRERASERLPALLAEAEGEVERWERAVEEAREGELPAWASAELQRSRPTAASRAPEALPPYRRYRTAGGLEVWVGRSSKDNDRLTFGSARPEDVWLHARSVPGSHVILRWPRADEAPPARDLEEAATLAALFSKARSSTLVPVDWTRRKHVRKPRGAPPGAVIPQRVKTVFVEPDPAVEERLREEVSGPP